MNVSKGAIEWLLGDDTGLSSRAIWAHMVGVVANTDHPWDPSDFARCSRLLAQPWAAGWRERMPEMAAHGREWAALAKEWPRLEVLLAEEQKRTDGMAPQLYKRIRELMRWHGDE